MGRGPANGSRAAPRAQRILSLVTLPHGALEPLGAPSLTRLHSAIAIPPPPPAERTSIVLLSRADMGRRRCLLNQQEMVRAIEAAVPEMRTVVFQACAPLPSHSPSCARTTPYKSFEN